MNVSPLKVAIRVTEGRARSRLVGPDLTECVGHRGSQPPGGRGAQVGDDPGSRAVELLDREHDPRLPFSAPFAVVAERHRPGDRRALLVALGVVVSGIVDRSAHAGSLSVAGQAGPATDAAENGATNLLHAIIESDVTNSAAAIAATTLPEATATASIVPITTR